MQNVPKIVRERMMSLPLAVNHPDANILAAFAEKSLPALERDSVLEHLGSCGECREIVALAVPEAETVTGETTTVRVPVRSGWLSWPSLRWGFAAAGIMALASVGILRYQQREQLQSVAKRSQVTAFAQNGTPASTASNAEAKKVEAEGDKTAVATPLPARIGSANDNAASAEKKAIADSTTSLDDIHGGSAGAAPGASVGGQQLPHGPRMPDAWQQKKMLQAQVPQIETPQLEARAMPPAGSPARSHFDYSPGVDRAKAPVPQVPDASAATNQTVINQTGHDEAALRRSEVPASPGQMGGYVTDPTGAVLANARITVTPTKAGAPATTATDSQGRWMIAGLPSGSYNARAEAPGFKTNAQSLNYDANMPSTYDFQLTAGNVSETVEVAAASAPVQVQSEAANVQGAITQKEVAETGLTGRNFSQMIALAPNAKPSLRWTISAGGGLQRSLDQGKTWQDVDVNASLTNPINATSLEVVAEGANVAVARTPGPPPSRKARKSKGAASFIFRSVAANGPEVWAGGTYGLLYHSADGGDHWTRVLPQSAGATLTGDIVGLQFPDAQHGQVVTSTSETWLTSDAGQTWQKQ